MKQKHLESPVVNALRELLPRNSRLLLAVSGGVDSVALGLGCLQVKDDLGLHLEVAHLDHKLRTESAEDAKFVEKWCEQHGLACHQGEPESKPPTANIESWARGERYRFLWRIREQVGADWILTAHHRDDLLETTLVKLIQNREPGGIVPRDLRRKLLRPLLAVTRGQITAFVEAQGGEWREDPSNLDQRFLRNKVRVELIPFIREKFGDSAVNSLTERSIQIGDDIEYLRSCASELANGVCVAHWGSKEWFRGLQETLGQTHRLNSWRVLEEALLPEVGYRIGRQHAMRVLKFLSGSRKVCELPKGISLVREEGGLRVVHLKGE